jgi:chitinase
MHRLGLAATLVAATAFGAACADTPHEHAQPAAPEISAPIAHARAEHARALRPAAVNTPWVMGYYTGYESAQYPVDRIEWSGLTHLAVAFYLPDSGGNLDESIFLDATSGPALAHALVDAAHGAGKRAIASIGGAGSHDAFLSSAQDQNRGNFIASLKRVVETYGYDGIDFDWEPFSVGDGPALVALLRDVRNALPGITLTMPVGPQNANLAEDLSHFRALAKLLDRVNIMSYGLAGTYEGWKSWHSSPLHWNGDPSTPAGIDQSASAYLAAGVPAGKLGIGSGFYGQCYSGPVRGPMQDLGGASIVADDGRMSFAHILDTYDFPGAKQWDDGAKVPFFAFASPQGPEGCSYISYEDERAIAEKGAYVKGQGLGGMIVWTIAQGYRPNAAEKNPLLVAARQALLQ